MGPGEALEVAYRMVPDDCLELALNPSPHDVAVIMMESDLMPSLALPASSLGPGIKNPYLQKICREISFEEKLFALTQES